MTAFVLKIMLAVSVICGNAAVVFVDGEKLPGLYTILRMISMMAVPFAAFMMVEGFYHTKSRKKYFLRLFSFGLIAEIPFLLSSSVGLQRIADGIKTHIDANAELNADNLRKLLESSEGAKKYYQDLYLVTGRYAIDGLLTLSMALLMIILIDKVREKYFGIKKFAFVSLSTLVIMGTLAVTIIFPFENPLEIVFFVAVFYYLRGNRPAISLMSLLMVICFYSKFGVELACGTVTAALIVQSYNGKQGSNKFKYVFYCIYPLQFLILFVIKHYM